MQSGIITIDTSALSAFTMSDKPGIYATLLAQEVGHIVLPSGMIHLQGLNTPQQAIQLGLQAEAVGDVNEYVVSRNLGVPMDMDVALGGA